MAARPNLRQTSVAPLPQDQELPDALNVEGAEQVPPVGFIERYNDFIKTFLVLVVIAIGYGLVRLGFFMYEKIHHDHQAAFNCQQQVVVALNGEGNYTSVSAALHKAPYMSDTRFCIKIKSGTYRESIYIGTMKRNIVLIGDGKDNTIITASGMPNNSPTVEVAGSGFMAINLTLANSGMALNSSSNEAIFYNCKIMGSFRTLLAENSKQFFRECQIYGTNSIITGSAAAYFQDCVIYVGEETKRKRRVITKQGRNFNWFQSGFVFDGCAIRPTPGRRTPLVSNQTYMGCPTGAYSMVIVMRSFLSGLINCKGWMYCNGFRPKNLLYGEFNNTGLGAVTKGRVNWTGVKVLNLSDAAKFTLQSFFEGGTEWLSKPGIPYRLN